MSDNKRYNVLDYGIKADAQYGGGTDNTTALRALIEKVPNGSVIFFPCGTYGIVNGICINKDVTFMGENQEMQTAGTAPKRIHDPLSIIKYIGDAPNVTMFKRSAGYHDVNFVNLVLDGGNSYTVSENPLENTKDPIKLPYPYLIGEVNKEGINGLDLSEKAPGIVKGCQFWGFSGFGVKMSQHKYVENCAFYFCKVGIVTTFSDNLLRNLWFCKGETAILMSAPKTNYASVNVSDTWADQLIGHFIKASEEVTSAKIVTNNIWLDAIQWSAFYLPKALLSSANIKGSFGRIGMDYGGLTDSNRSIKTAHKSDFLVCRYILNSIFEITVDATKGKGKNNGECFSRLFTTTAVNDNLNNKIVCNRFPLSKFYDTKTSIGRFKNSSYHGTDGFIEL